MKNISASISHLPRSLQTLNYRKARMKGKSRRFVVVFDEPIYLKYRGGAVSPARKKRLATVTALGPIAAYRKVTGYTGLLSASNGYSEQLPARRLFPYAKQPVPFTLSVDLKNPNNFSSAFVFPLGSWK